jgi:hypothetical protein
MALDGHLDPTAAWRVDSLLPATATLADRVRERAIRLPARLQDASVRVGDILTDLPDAALPFVIYELGLEIVTPYVSDLRRVIQDGRAWERIRGTPVSIEMALGWIGVTPLWIEEHPQDPWWDLFQLALPEPVFNRALARIVALARLSKPAHMELVRLYNACGDERVLHTDGYGGTDGHGLQDDWSGVWVDQPDGRRVKVAWCRKSGARLTGIADHMNISRAISRLRAGRLTRGHAFHTDRDATDGPVMQEPWWCQSIVSRSRFTGTTLRSGRRRPIPWAARRYGDPASDVVAVTHRRVTRRADFATRICGTRVTSSHADLSYRIAPGRSAGPRLPIPYDRAPRFFATGARIVLSDTTQGWSFDMTTPPSFDASIAKSFDLAH